MATPMRAVAAATSRSARRRSGRRESSSDGTIDGISGAATGIAPGASSAGVSAAGSPPSRTRRAWMARGVGGTNCVPGNEGECRAGPRMAGLWIERRTAPRSEGGHGTNACRRAHLSGAGGLRRPFRSRFVDGVRHVVIGRWVDRLRYPPRRSHRRCVELEVLQDLPRDPLVGDEGDHLEPPLALGAGQHIDGEYLPEELRPGDAVAPSRRWSRRPLDRRRRRHWRRSSLVARRSSLVARRSSLVARRSSRGGGGRGRRGGPGVRAGLGDDAPAHPGVRGEHPVVSHPMDPRRRDERRELRQELARRQPQG